jgi:hypothetical protein
MKQKDEKNKTLQINKNKSINKNTITLQMRKNVEQK